MCSVLSASQAGVRALHVPVLCLTQCAPPLSRLESPPGKNTGVGCLAFLQGVFPIQGSNLHLLQSRALAGRFFTMSAT